MTVVARTVPVAFLCHGSEDKDLARQLATDLRSRGIDVFFDEWEIGPGDSIRQKIDGGLGRCTHFLALLTATSLTKAWVNAEIDAGFVRKVEGSAMFIPLRAGLAPNQLPPLLRGLHSPTIDDYSVSLPRLVSALHGISLRPLLGPPPAPLVNHTRWGNLSPAGEAIVRLMVEHSQRGRKMDPQISPDYLHQAGLSDYDIQDAVDELETRTLIGRLSGLGCGDLGFFAIYPEEELFIRFDKLMHPWDASQDALRLATDLVNGDDEFLDIPKIAAAYGWSPRRMNPALAFLDSRSLGQGLRAIDRDYSVVALRRTPATRRFVRDHS